MRWVEEVESRLAALEVTVVNHGERIKEIERCLEWDTHFNMMTKENNDDGSLNDAVVDHGKRIKEIERALGYVNKDIITLYMRDSSHECK